MPEVNKDTNLMSLVNPKTTRSEMVEKVASLLTDHEVNILGKAPIDAADKIVETIAFFYPFGSDPEATFDKEAFDMTGGDLFGVKENIQIWNTIRRIGVLEEAKEVQMRPNELARYRIAKGLVDILRDPENGYLTDEED